MLKTNRLAGISTLLTIPLLFVTQCGVVYSYSANGYLHPSKDTPSPKLVCYFPLPHVKYDTPLPPGLNSTLCTHVIFINSHITDCQMVPWTPTDIELFHSAIPILRQQNPIIKVLMSNGNAPGHDFNDVLLTEGNRQKYIASVITFLRNYSFDGVDLDWEFPGYAGRPAGQRHNFTLLIQNLRKAFEQEALQTKRPRLLLSMALACGDGFVKIYEAPKIAKLMDLANLMGYDFHTFSWSWPFTEYNSPLFVEGKKFFSSNLNYSANAWAEVGVPKENIIIGVPMYCRAYKLLDPALHFLGAPAVDHGDCESGKYTCNALNSITKYKCRFHLLSLKDVRMHETKLLAKIDAKTFDKACHALQKLNATRVFDDVAKVPYLYYGNQWVTYDDEESLTIKAKWAIDSGYGGIMAFNFLSDDIHGVCDGKTKFPLISAIHRALFQRK